MVGNGVGAKHGVLFKTAVSLEEAGKVKIVALDKTGTITKGEPEVTGLYPVEGVTENELLNAAYALEAKSEHPLARAIVREAEKRGLSADEVTDFKALPGNGLTATRKGLSVIGGSVKFISTQTHPEVAVLSEAEALADKGSTPLLFTENGRMLGIIAVADAVKEESADAVRELKSMGIEVVMLTGDNLRTAQAVGREAGIDKVVAGVLPDGKEAVVTKLKSIGKVAMVGDGINDAPALTSADIGVAIGAGTDVAIDAADVVLMNSKLSDVPAEIRLSRATLTNIRENLFWAFIYNVIGIPLAAGCFIGLFGWQLNPVYGAAAMSLSSFCVVTNALRLNLFDMYSSKRDRRGSKSVSQAELSALINEFNSVQEEKAMNKTMKIEGMMCPHCQAHVEKALEAVSGVTAVEVSHEKGTAVVTMSEKVDNAALKAAVEQAGYTVKSID